MSDSALNELAQKIERAGLGTPARIMLDVCAPLDIISSQLALFAQPFTTGSRWNSYAAALSEQAGWQELRRILSQQD